MIAEKYRLLDLLGRGGMGSVWRAEHLTLNSPVAVKLLEPSVASDPLALARFMREARAAAKLRSPHVVQILDHGVDEGIPYIVMELLEGESLATRLAREGRLGLSETVLIVTHIARALARAHAAGIVHRDLKPDNVFLVRDDDEQQQQLAKLLDFGIAKSQHGALEARSEQSTGPGILVGTPYYASPEQAQGAKVLDHRSDIWALGVIAFECLLGERPFRGESLGDVLLGICIQPLPIPSQRGPVPKGFDAWFAKACARAREQRFESAKLAASELAKLCDSLPAEELPRSAQAPNANVVPRALLSTPLPTTLREPRPRPTRRATFASVAFGLVFALAFLAYAARTRLPAASQQSAAESLAAGNARSEPQPKRALSAASLAPGVVLDVAANRAAPALDAGPPPPSKAAATPFETKATHLEAKATHLPSAPSLKGQRTPPEPRRMSPTSNVPPPRRSPPPPPPPPIEATPAAGEPQPSSAEARSLIDLGL